MKQLSTLFLLLLFGISSNVVAECAHKQKNSSQLQSEIVLANESFILAFKNSDDSAMASLYTETGQLMPTNSDFITGKEGIQKFWKSAFDSGLKQVKLQTLEVEGINDSAVEVGKYTLFAKDDQIADSGKYIVIWKRVDGTWKLHRDIFNSSLPAAE